MKVVNDYFHKLTVITFMTVAFHTNSATAQIIPDATLPNNSSITTRDNIKIIEGGTQAGTNLFHSFEQFTIPTNQTASFNNAVNIQNIITRITGKSISNIDGIIRANGTANLFLINPNGIVFGENAALNIGGSFLATTASSINFADGTKFNATQPQIEPLLTVNVPVGLQFGSTSAPIRNQSQAPTDDTNAIREFVGLQVPVGETLALIGGDVILEGGNLTVDSGRIELASVGNNGLVSLDSRDKGWVLGYENVENFQNIELKQRVTDDSFVISSVRVDSKVGGGNIQIRGDSVQVIGFNVVNLINQMDGDIADVGNLNVTARKLVLQDGGGITNSTSGSSTAPDITINASESVEVVGGFDFSGFYLPSNLSSTTVSNGIAGNLNVNTSRLLVKDGGIISTDVTGDIQNSRFLEATGEAGNVIINASELVEIVGTSPKGLRSFIGSKAFNSGNAGNVTISTKQLIVRNGGEVSVASELPQLPSNITINEDISNFGNAGEINIIVDNILLDNQGKLISETESANGGNINLQLKDLLLLRRNSQISTNAGKSQLGGDGGNININIPNGFIVALPEENSDITANAFRGSGGRVDINANGIFGIQPRSRDELTELLTTNNPSELNPQELLTSDITAISQQNPNLNGTLSINVQDVELTRELVELPETPVDTKVSQVCRFSRGNQSEFVYSRRGGLPSLPGEVLRGDSGLDVGWVDGGTRGEGESERGREGERETRGQGDWGIRERDGIQNLKKTHPLSKQTHPLSKSIIQNRIVEATGWVKDKNGDIFFVAGKDNYINKNLQGC